MRKRYQVDIDEELMLEFKLSCYKQGVKVKSHSGCIEHAMKQVINNASSKEQSK